MPLTFVAIGKRSWRAVDGADTYDIILSERHGGHYAFKNEVIALAGGVTHAQALAACEYEQTEQEWLSNNPENAEKNAAHREVRNLNRRKRVRTNERQPRLYPGD